MRTLARKSLDRSCIALARKTFDTRPGAVGRMEARLGAIASVSDQKVRSVQYGEVLDELLSGDGDVDGLKLAVVHMLSDDVPLVISRQILQRLCQELRSLPAERHKAAAEYALEKITPRVVSFEEQVSVLREGLAKLYQDEQAWSRAAQILAGIDLDSGIRVLTDEYKLKKCVQIAMLYLEDDDALNADTFIKKASFLLAACKVRSHERPARIPSGRRPALPVAMTNDYITNILTTPSAPSLSPRRGWPNFE